jgi:arabinogalactan endo-1,4-beta-galactosidase
MYARLTLFFAVFLPVFSPAQSFYFGADLSYVNEMEDCGVTYREHGTPKDPYRVFADHGCNLARLRLWHTPAWYDTLNAGKRYSDFQDVRKSIRRAKEAGMRVLLDFHLSDTWADPSRQIMPAAWLAVAHDLPLLGDSVYRYVSAVLLALHSEGLLPEMVQIGNETNRGILLTPAVDATGWSLDWKRNSYLFKRAIEAVRDVEKATDESVQVALHIAGPADANWLMTGFWNHGVTDFDIIGLSYYWAWHKPTTIADAGAVMDELRRQYPDKAVMIFETGYIWTTEANDQAPNIIGEVHPDYAPASPYQQSRWNIDLTQEVINQGGAGVIYWEPAWVSSPCRTPWGQGSHQEHAAFFDFDNNLMADGGIRLMTHTYQPAMSASGSDTGRRLDIWPAGGHVFLKLEGFSAGISFQARLTGVDGKIIATESFRTAGSEAHTHRWEVPGLKPGVYYVTIQEGNVFVAMRGIAWEK